MGNKFSQLCIPTKSKRKVIKPANSSSSTTVPPPFTDLIQEIFLKYNNVAPLPLNGTPSFICQICFETKPLNDSFNVEGCTHFYCTSCTLKYIVSKLQDNVLNLVCPEPRCSGVLNPQYCKPILPNNVSVWWENAISESVVPEKVKFYCPYSDCSALLINDGHNSHRGEVIRDSKCPYCKRSICVQCKVPWHPESTCAKFQRLNGRNDDLMLDLARRKRWKQCPHCKHYVEKIHGCSKMQCRLVSFPLLLLLTTQCF